MPNQKPESVVPCKVNRVDMAENGTRSCALSNYGSDGHVAIMAVMTAWEVVDSYLINPIASQGGKRRVPQPSWEGGPEYMLLFADGLWRYASFCGLNGPPWARCEWEGYYAARGISAWLKYRINSMTKVRNNLKQSLADCDKEIEELMKSLSESSEV